MLVGGLDARIWVCRSTNSDPDIADTLAMQIDRLNTDRRAEEAAVRIAAEQMAEEKQLRSLICLFWCWPNRTGMKVLLVLLPAA